MLRAERDEQPADALGHEDVGVAPPRRAGGRDERVEVQSRRPRARPRGAATPPAPNVTAATSLGALAPVTCRQQLVVGGPRSPAASSSPVTTGLKAATRSPRARSAAAIAAATIVLPTPVSVPVTKKPRRAIRLRRAGHARRRLGVEHGLAVEQAAAAAGAHLPGSGAARAPPPGRPRSAWRSPGRNPACSAARPSTRAASRSSSLVCEAITARRSREVPGATVGGRIAWAKTPRSSAASQIAQRGLASPTTSGTICVVEPATSKPSRASSSRSDVGVGLQALDAARLLDQQLQRGERAGDRRRRRRRGEDERARRVDQVLGHRRAAGRVRAVGAQRLAQRADDDVDLALQPRLGHGAAAAGPDAAGRVRLVDDDARVVAPRELDDAPPAARRRRPSRTPVGDDQRPAPVGLRAAPHARCSTSQWS